MQEETRSLTLEQIVGLPTEERLAAVKTVQDPIDMWNRAREWASVFSEESKKERGPGSDAYILKSREYKEVADLFFAEYERREQERRQ